MRAGGEEGDPMEGGEGGSQSQFLTVPTSSPDGSTRGSAQNLASPLAMRVSSLSAEDYVEANKLRHSLRFHFMNVHEKWKARRRFPWKLCVQLLKIVIVTLQLYLFGTLRTDHITYISQLDIALKHLFLQNWTSTSDVLVYPPAAAPFSVYTIPQFYDALGFAVQQYYDLDSISLNRYHKLNEKDPGFCGKFFNKVEVDVISPQGHMNYSYDTRLEKKCWNIMACRDLFVNYTGGKGLGSKMQECTQRIAGFSSVLPGTLVEMSLNFSLFTVHVSPKAEANSVSCYQISTTLTLNNHEHSGEVLVTLETDIREMGSAGCKGDLKPLATTWNILIDILDIVVVCVCCLSLVLVLRAIIKGHFLRVRAETFFVHVLSTDMDFSDKSEFYNFWFFLMALNDSLVILGTFFKMSIDYGSFNQDLFTGTTMLLGVGTLLVWAGVLRYLGFFTHYNVLIKTMKKSLPNVLRFMVCAGLLYFGFLLCGWIVLGPYSIKFRDALSTSECLFSLINGDDMFATFFTISSANQSVKWFSRIYLYIFISLFIYVVLSLFISIIMDAYEVIKEKYNPDCETRSSLWEFIKDCTDTPRPGNYDATEGLMEAFCGTGCARWCRSLKLLGRGNRTQSLRRGNYTEIGSATESDAEMD